MSDAVILPESSGGGGAPDRLAEARRLRAEGKSAEALPLLEELARQEPANALVLQELAAALADLSRLPAAANAARRALALDPSLELAHGVLAWVATTQGRFKEAEAELQARLRALPEAEVTRRAAVYNQMGVLYFRQKRFEEAQEVLGKALELQPESPTMRFNLAMLHLQAKQWDQAQAELERTLAAAEVPEDIAYLAHVNLGHLYARQGRYGDTRTQFDQALALRRSFFGWLYRAIPFLARFRPTTLLIVVLIIALIVWNIFLVRR